MHVGGEGTSGGTVFCDVFFAIDTRRPGERSGAIRVMLAGDGGEKDAGPKLVVGPKAGFLSSRG